MGQVSTIHQIEVSNGVKIRFWTDLWMGDECLKQKFPFFFSCCNNKDRVLVEFSSNTGCHMNFTRNMNDWEIDDFCLLILQLDYTHIDQSKRDSLVWIASNDVTVSVKKCYNLLIKQTRFWDTSWP